jgi:hypothetical protein
VPIFGLHFIFFEWLPYARVATNEDSLLELPLVYIETSFNAFQVRSKELINEKSLYFEIEKKTHLTGLAGLNRLLFYSPRGSHRNANCDSQNIRSAQMFKINEMH